MNNVALREGLIRHGLVEEYQTDPYLHRALDLLDRAMDVFEASAADEGVPVDAVERLAKRTVDRLLERPRFPVEAFKQAWDTRLSPGTLGP